MSLRKQLQVDHELRSVLAFFGITCCVVFLANLITDALVSLIVLIVAPAIGHLVGKYGSYNLQSTSQASLIGSVFGYAVSYTLMYGEARSTCMSRYFALLAMFHFSEFVFTAISNRRSLQPDSFLLNHSVGYWVAAMMSWVEFGIEALIIPSMKSYRMSLIGLLLCVIGEIIRKMAMMHAGTGFTHRLAMTKRCDHHLVTSGIYGWMRHPGYCGWFVWAISTQIVLCNPLCTIAYAVVTWHFFSQRIYDEERDLIRFFNREYIMYQEKVWSGVPFVTGFQLQ